MNHESIFTKIYKTQEWGQSFTEAFVGSSGPGSSTAYNEEYIEYLRTFIKKFQISSVVDIGCGDWRCGPAIYGDLSCSYVGYDIYQEMIDSHNKIYKSDTWRFECKNCAAELDELESADLLVVKDVLQHWSDEYVANFLKFQTEQKKYKYILITNCAAENTDSLQTSGGWRQLPKSHPLFQPYPFVEVFRYSTKQVLLLMP